MEMTETEDGLFFQNNWAKFVEDNSITNGDCLLFSYGGYALFEFVLFDQFGCEKIVVRDAQPQVNKEVEEEEDDDDVVVVISDDDDKVNDYGDSGDGGDDSNFVNEDDKTKVENYGRSGDEDDSNFVIEEDKNEVEEDDEEVKGLMLGSTKSKQKKKQFLGIGLFDIDVFDGLDECEKMVVEFPMWFKAFVGEALPKEIFLMNQRMKIWSVEITEIGDDLYFKNCWAKFVRENFIKTGDLMVFKYEGYDMFEMFEIVVIDDNQYN
nr:B3 domain-containing protein REM20-like [Ipomoea batatas]